MFPIRWNFPFRKKNGALSTIGAEIEGAQYTLPTASAETKGGVKIGSGLAMDGEVLNNSNPTPYSLPTASSETKGGVKIGSKLSMDGEILSADAQLPAYTSSESGKVLGVDSEGHLVWATPASGGGTFSLIGTVNDNDSDRTVTLPSDSAEIYLFFTRRGADGYWGCKHLLLSVVEIIQTYDAEGIASVGDDNRKYGSSVQPGTNNDVTLYFKYNASTKVIEIINMFQVNSAIQWTCMVYAK